MTPVPLRHAALGDLERELATTRRVLDRVPDAHLDWRPHEKSMTLGGLATHIANLLSWQQAILHAEEYDFATAPPPRRSLPSRDEVLALFDENAEALKGGLAESDDARLRERWTLRHGEHVIVEAPRAAVLRSTILSHIIHHRGQLTVYLRLLDVPVPPVYGPTADERGGF